VRLLAQFAPLQYTQAGFLLQRVCFLVYSNLHKRFKCLEIALGRVYISQDVIFDKNVFPFSHFHNNTGARLRSEILLLPPSLRNPLPGDESLDGHVPNGENSNSFDEETGTISHAGGAADVGTGSGANPCVFP
jgi:hypothetical protein